MPETDEPIEPPRARPGPAPVPSFAAKTSLAPSTFTRSSDTSPACAAYPHPNRTLFYDDMAVAYLLGFFNPTIRSLRTLEDASQTPEMRPNTSVPRIPRSTLSDANKVFDPTLLEPIIEQLRGRIPNLGRADPQRAVLTRRILATDSSLFSVSANVAWALGRRGSNGKKKAAIRLNLQWATATGVPQCVTISGEEQSEADVVMKNLEPDCIYVMDRGYVSYALLSRILGAGSDLVLRLKSNINFEGQKDLPLSDEDRAAGVISD